MKLNKLAPRLAKHFAENNWTWTIDGKSEPPGIKELSLVLKDAQHQLKDEDNFSQITTGRLIIQKNEGHDDVYIYVGTLDNPEDK